MYTYKHAYMLAKLEHWQTAWHYAQAASPIAKALGFDTWKTSMKAMLKDEQVQRPDWRDLSGMRFEYRRNVAGRLFFDTISIHAEQTEPGQVLFSYEEDDQIFKLPVQGIVRAIRQQRLVPLPPNQADGAESQP